MSETKSTPGPWRFDREFGEIRADFHGVICRPAFRGSAINSTEEIRANAQLIAAAPELLAALELCLKNSGFRRASGVESGPMIEREIEAARAAINKAKGV